jgi:phosphate transport system permease protein
MAMRIGWQAKESLVKIGLMLAASTSILIVALIFVFLGKEAFPFFTKTNIFELFGTNWNPVTFGTPEFGMVPLFSGTLLVTVLALIIAVPLGVVTAVYISEFSRPVEREILKPFIELLAGIPSVVLGFFGLVVLAPLVKGMFGLSTGTSALTSALLLALMALPTIITLSEDAIKSVPFSYREGSLAMGATKLQTAWLVTVPAGLSGILSGVLLGVGRVIGETMAVLMVSGNSPVVTINPLSTVRTMTATIAAEMGEVHFGDLHYNALFVIGVILLVFTFALVQISQRLLKGQIRE